MDENLKKVELAEEIIKDLGIPTTRVRVHNEIARIEVAKEYFNLILSNPQIIDEIKKLGFQYVTLDLSGLKNGSFDIKK